MVSAVSGHRHSGAQDVVRPSRFVRDAVDTIVIGYADNGDARSTRVHSAVATERGIVRSNAGVMNGDGTELSHICYFGVVAEELNSTRAAARR
jgi:hypothetical protein